jgi:hypothetical protein
MHNKTKRDRTPNRVEGNNAGNPGAIVLLDDHGKPGFRLRFGESHFGVPDNLRIENLADEERSLIRDSIVDLSAASRFLRRQVVIGSEFCRHLMKITDGKYKLSSELLRRVLIWRYVGSGNKYLRPEDRLAFAILGCVRSMLFEAAFCNRRGDEEAWQNYFKILKGKESANLRATGFVQVPVAPNGAVLEPFSRPDLPQLTLRFAINTQLAVARINGQDFGFFDVKNTEASVEEEVDGEPLTIERLPELTIKLEGAPVATVMAASLAKSAADREFTKQLLNGVRHEVDRFLGLAAKRGRPAHGLSEKAATLIDHEGHSIRSAVRVLCLDRNRPEHKHTKRCDDKIRLAARQYYSSLRNTFRRYSVTANKTDAENNFRHFVRN